MSFDCIRGRQNTLNEIVIKVKWSVKSKIWKKEEKVSKFEISVKIEKILSEENVRWNQCWLKSSWNIFPWSWLLKIWWRKTKMIYAKSINSNLRISFYEQIEFIFVRQLKSCFVNDSVYLWVTANSLLKKIGCERNFVLHLWSKLMQSNKKSEWIEKLFKILLWKIQISVKLSLYANNEYCGFEKASLNH